MDAATISAGLLASGLISGVITQFTKNHISDSKKVRTVWALAVSGGVGLLSACISAGLTVLSGSHLTWAAFAVALVTQIAGAAGAAQAIYAGVKALVPDAQDVDVDGLVEAAKTVVSAAESVASATDTKTDATAK